MHNRARASKLHTQATFVALLLLVLTGGIAQARETQRMSFPVTLSDGRTYTVVGYLHSERGHHGKPLQVVMHGATYTHEYWDMPDFDHKSYSYADYMTRRGWAVLALDLLGSGESSMPNGDFLDLAAVSDSVRQVVIQLRTGYNQLGARFHLVYGVGHSLGSAVAIHAQATYQPFNAIVSTGLGHVPHEMPISPEFAARALATPYFYLLPVERQAFFYTPEFTSQEIIDYDNARFGGALSRGLFLTVMFNAFNPEVSRVDKVRGPVLVQLGENDFLFPASLGEEEPAWFPLARVTMQSIPDAGHAFNMHEGRKHSWKGIDHWLKSQIFGRPSWD